MTKVKTEIKRSSSIKKGNILRETFGKHKFSKPITKLMKEMDKALYDI